MKILKLLLSFILVITFSYFNYFPATARELDKSASKSFQVVSDNEIESPSELKNNLHKEGFDLKTYKDQSARFVKYDSYLNKYVEVNTISITSYVIKNVENSTTSGKKPIVDAAAVIHQSITCKTYTNSGGHTYGKLTKATGKVTDFNSGFKFVKATVELHSMGLGVLNQNCTKHSTTASWSFNAPTNWVYTLMHNDFSAKGAVATVTITRDGSKNYTGTYNLQVN